MADLTFRRALPADAAVLTDLLRAAYKPYRDAGIALPPVEEGVADDIRDRDAWVAMAGEWLIGFLVVSVGEPAHLMNLAVAPDAAGQGHGAALLRFAESRAAESGARRISLTTHAEMQATRAWYRSKGWAETGRDGQKVYLAKRIDQEDAE